MDECYLHEKKIILDAEVVFPFKIGLDCLSGLKYLLENGALIRV